MILAPATFARLGLLVLLFCVLQVSGVGQIRLFGGAPDLVPLLVAAIALYGGSVAGAGTGFATGFLLDLAAGQHLGASSLVLTAVGYGVGRYAELRDPANGLAPIPVGAAATAAWALAFAGVSFLLEVEATVSALVLREIAVTTLVNAVIAVPVFALVRRVVRASLIEDPIERRRRRRRGRPTPAGPLGLRGLEAPGGLDLGRPKAES